MIITIAGDVGSGKSTAAALLQKALPDFEKIDAGLARRDLAKEKSMTIEEFNEWSMEHLEEGDKAVDDKIMKEVQKRRNVVLSTWLGPKLYPHSLKVYLAVDPVVAATRIFEEKLRDNSRNEEQVKTVQEQQDRNEYRMKQTGKRFKKLYNFDAFDSSQHDLVIDTTEMTPEQVVQKILHRVIKE